MEAGTTQSTRQRCRNITERWWGAPEVALSDTVGGGVVGGFNFPPNIS